MPNYNPRHVYVVSFDDNNRDKYYICSHDDIAFDTDVWASQTSGTANTLRSVWYSAEAGYWIACGDSGTILKSVDGETWTDYSVSSASPAITFSLRTVKYWKGNWWIVGYGNASTQGTILRSSNGETWTSIDLGVSPIVPGYLVEIGFSDDLMIFGGWSHPFSDTSGMTVITADGVNFNIEYHSDAAGVYAIDYDFNEKTFLIAGSHANDSDATPYAVLTADGVTKEEVDVSAFTYAIFSVQHNGSNWVMTSGAFNFQTKYSAKGRLWKAATFEGDLSSHWIWRNVKDAKGNLYIVGGDQSTEGKIYRSIDNGETFQHVLTTSSPNFFRKAVHGQDYWIAVGDSGTIYKSGVALANIFNGTLKNPSTTSQSLNPIRANASIGNISFSFSDSNQDVSALLNDRLKNKQGLRAKRVQHWAGEEGAEWSSGYDLLQTQQFYNAIGWSDNAYNFSAQDIQRSELTDIFDPKKTTLTASLGLTGITINLNSTADFSLIQHGGGFSDAPNQAVLYLKIKDEIIRCSAIPSSTTATIDNESSTLSGAAAANDTVLSVTDHSAFDQSGNGYVISGSPAVEYPIKWTGKSDSPHQLTGVTGVTAAFDSGATIYDLQGRAVLGSRLAEHNVDTNQPVDKRTKVEEYIYYEMPAVQFLNYVLTGNYYGNSPAFTAPAHHTLGISADWVATSEFLAIGSDLWDTSDDTAGFPLRFEGLKKTNAKKFIEEQILFICGLYTPILPTGELGLRRMSGVVSDSAYSRIVDESNIIGISNIRYDMNDIHNDIFVRWNYDAVAKEYTRTVYLTDQDSQTKWGQTRQLDIPSLGLKGSSHTDSIIGNLFNTWRDRHAGPPFKCTVQLDYSQRDLRIGDIVRLKLSNIPEFTDQNRAYGSLDISVEIQKLSVNYVTGVVTAEVFGSTQRGGPLVIGDPSLDDTFYTSEGSELGAMAVSSPLGIVATDSGGVLTFTGNSSLTGVSDLNSSTATTDNQQGIFYYDGDIVINSGVTVTISNNVEIRCSGTFTNNGTIDGVGGGLAGTATDAGNEGYIGTTRASGGITVSIASNEDQNFSVPETAGDVSTVGPFNIVNNDTVITGKPSDLRGTSGGKGGDFTSAEPTPVYTATGGNGGAGGAGLLIICRGAVGGINSSIDLSGADGSDGAQVATPAYTFVGGFIAGSGGGGYPGALCVVLDGNTVTETITPYFTANLGNSNLFGVPYTAENELNAFFEPNNYYRSTHEGFQAESKSISNLYVHYLTEAQTVATDTPSQATLPTAINVNPHEVTQNSINMIGLEISADAPASTNYHAARLYIRRQNTEGWQEVGDVESGQEAVFWVPADGATYEIKAHSISAVSRTESDDYIDRIFTVDPSNIVVMPEDSEVIGVGNLSGNAADETLNPNGFFDFSLESYFLSVGSEPTPPVSIITESPDVDGNMLHLPAKVTGYGYASKSFRLIPGRKYKFIIRVKSDSGGSPAAHGGLFFGLQYKDRYTEEINSVSRDGVEYFISSTDLIITNGFIAYEFDFVIPSNAFWGNVGVFNWAGGSYDYYISRMDVVSLFATHEVADYGDETTFFYFPYWNLDDLTLVQTSGGTVTIFQGAAYLTTTTTNGSNAAMSFSTGAAIMSSKSFSSVNRRLKTKIVYSSFEDTTVFYWGMGAFDLNGGSNAAVLVYDGTQSPSRWYFHTSDTSSPATPEETTITAPGATFVPEIVFIAGSYAALLIDGVEVARHSTNIPSGTSDDDEFIRSGLLRSGSGASDSDTAFIGETKILLGFEA